MDKDNTKYKTLKKSLKEESSGNQLVASKSLIHQHHGKLMIRIENQGPCNTGSFNY